MREKTDLELDPVENFVHATTVAINTAIERTGARTALVVTKGTCDVYQMGRGNGPEVYNISLSLALTRRGEGRIPSCWWHHGDGHLSNYH